MGLTKTMTKMFVVGLEGLEAERRSIEEELRGIETLCADGEASVDELERALVRKGALQVRRAAVESKIAAERERQAAAERERRKQEAFALKQEADVLMRKAVDVLIALQPLANQHMALVTRMQALGGVSYTSDNRGHTLRATISSLLQTIAPGRFYPIDQQGTLADRERE